MMWKVLSQPSFLQVCRKDQTQDFIYFAVITDVSFSNSNTLKRYIKIFWDADRGAIC
jgi:hypothetical protein